MGKEGAKMITPCSSKPNCVSSIERDLKHFIGPLRYKGSLENAKHRLMKILDSLKRTHIVAIEDFFVKAISESLIFGFIDDLSFQFDDFNKLVHVKSASRSGYSDLGVNRRRIEKIRKLFA